MTDAYTPVERSDFDRALAALAEEDIPALWAYAIGRFSSMSGHLLQLMRRATGHA
ncbi:hypothetical protein ABZ721_09220 [Streptomyces sp. NPDC006733]|uniref:hypothetical protein n=1 Tax=Streptomyces sp. NPDC006733 TaxID=3155460 RepID=UPI0033CBA7C3